MAKFAWLAPKPRIAPEGGLLVRTALRLDIDVGHLVGTAGMAGGALQDLAADAGIGAVVADDARLDREQMPSASQATV